MVRKQLLLIIGCFAVTVLQASPARIVEQDIVVKEYTTDRFEGYKETVLRFTWHRRNLVNCQIGIVEYDTSGRVTNRGIMQGWLTPNWQKIADEVSADYGFSWEKIQQYGK